jgi:hypothetical protein
VSATGTGGTSADSVVGLERVTTHHAFAKPKDIQHNYSLRQQGYPIENHCAREKVWLHSVANLVN